MTPREYIVRSTIAQDQLRRWLEMSPYERYRSPLGAPAAQAMLRGRRHLLQALFPHEFRSTEVAA